MSQLSELDVLYTEFVVDSFMFTFLLESNICLLCLYNESGTISVYFIVFYI